jgi:MFS superfamily sulfate permease-like transporter
VTIIRSLIYGYLGAIIGGLAVAVVAVPLQASLEAAAGAAAVTGVVFGLFGLLLPWRQALMVPVRARRGR